MQAIKVTRGGVYIPDLFNQGRNEEEKIRIHWRFLSFFEQQELLESGDLEKPFAYEGKITAAMITKIENLLVDDGNEEREITTGAELLGEPTLERLAMEVWLYLRDQAAVAKKN
jgi:hypothetical protein